MSTVMTRREFVALGATIGGAAVAVPASGCAPSGGDGSPVPTPSRTYGAAGTAGRRVLVGYATAKGSTVGVAEAIGEVLGVRGFAADVRPLNERPALDGYDAAVLGSAVHGGRWLAEATAFAEANRRALAAIPTALFCVHIMNLGEGGAARAKRRAYLDPIRALIEPSDEAFFAGVGPTADDSSAIARWAFRMFGGGGEGDCRDWEAIRGWARDLAV